MKAEFKDGCLVLTIPVRMESAETDDELATLTKRERQVLGHLQKGLANKEIAAALGVCERTVKFFVSEILRKTGCAGRMQVMRKFPARPE